MAMNPRLLRPTANDSPASIPGLALWLDAAAADALYTTDAGPVTAVSSPLDIAGCALWLDGADSSAASMTLDGTSLDAWKDKSGNGRDFTAAGAARPTLTAAGLNGLSVVTLDGNDQMTNATNIVGLTSVSMFAVAFNDGSQFGGVISSTAGTDSSPGLLVDQFHFACRGLANLSRGTSGSGPIVATGIVSSGASAVFYGGLQADADAASGSLAAVTTTAIGTYRQTAANFLTGYIAEIIVFNTALSTSDRARVEAYLAAKWGISGVHAPAVTASQPVGYWRDRSGNGRHATQSTAASRPVVGTVNSRRAVNFDGVDDTVAYLQGLTSDDLTTFCVYRYDTLNNGIVFDYGYSGDNTNAQSSANTGFQNSIGFQVSSSGTVTSRLDSSRSFVTDSTSRSGRPGGFVGGAGVTALHTAACSFSASSVKYAAHFGASLDGSTRFNGTNLSLLSLGSRRAGATPGEASVFLDGQVCEFLMYERNLPQALRRKVEQYLARKWGITLAPQVSNAEAQDWVNRVYANGGTVSQSTASAVSTFCDAIEAAGIRDRFARLNLFCGDSLNAALVPLYRNRAAYSGRNLIADNENYLGSSYTYSRLTPTSGGVGPTGGPVLTMTETAAAGVHLWRTNYSIPITVGATYTWSVYVKDVTNGLIVLRDNASRVALFDVSAESVVASAGGATGSIADAGGGWYRLSMELSAVSNPGEFTVSGAPDGHSTATLPSYTGDTGHSFTLSAPQLEAGSLTAYDLNTTLGNATDTNNGPFVSGDYAETGASGGLTGNGSSKYLNAGVNILSQLLASDAHLSVLGKNLETSAGASSTPIGGGDGGISNGGFITVGSSGTPSNIARIAGNGFQNITGSSPVGAGLFTLSAIASTDQRLFVNSSQTGIVTADRGSSALTTKAVYVLAANNNNATSGPTSGTAQGYSIGRGLTAAQVTSFYNAMLAFNTALSRA
jgi:hypothetical protein